MTKVSHILFLVWTSTIVSTQQYVPRKELEELQRLQQPVGDEELLHSLPNEYVIPMPPPTDFPFLPHPPPQPSCFPSVFPCPFGNCNRVNVPQRKFGASCRVDYDGDVICDNPNDSFSRFQSSEPGVQVYHIKEQIIPWGAPRLYHISSNLFIPSCQLYKIGYVLKGTRELEKKLIDRVPKFIEVFQDTIRFFPTRSDVSDYKLNLVCENTGVTIDMLLSVQDRELEFNHEFILEFEFNHKHYSPLQRIEYLRVYLQRALLHHSDDDNAKTFNDLIFLSTQHEFYPNSVTFYDESVNLQNCSISEIIKIYEKLQSLVRERHSTCPLATVVRVSRVGLGIIAGNKQCGNETVQKAIEKHGGVYLLERKSTLGVDNDANSVDEKVQSSKSDCKSIKNFSFLVISVLILMASLLLVNIICFVCIIKRKYALANTNEEDVDKPNKTYFFMKKTFKGSYVV